MKIAAFILMIFAFAACGGSGGGSSAPTGGTNSTIPVVTAVDEGVDVAVTTPIPVIPVVVVTPNSNSTPISSLAIASSVPTPYTVGVGSSPVILTSNHRAPEAVATLTPNCENVADFNNDNCSATWGLQVPSNLSAIYAVQTFDLNSSIVTGNTLYSPTMKIGNSCLELTTYYFGSDSGIFVWDWCRSTPTDIVILSNTANELGNYLRSLPGGSATKAEYVGEIYQDITARKDWHALLFNFTTNQWNEIYNTSNDATLVDGYSTTLPSWDMYEQHYGNSQYCPSFGVITSRNIQNQSGGQWVQSNFQPLGINGNGGQSGPPGVLLTPCFPSDLSASSGFVSTTWNIPGTFIYTSNSWIATNN